MPGVSLHLREWLKEWAKKPLTTESIEAFKRFSL